jgi:AraC-like DNA-binding protein
MTEITSVDRGSDPPSVVVEKTSYSPGFCGEWHHNGKAQLIYPSRGTMTLHTTAGSWVVPPLRACWLPADEPHCVEASGRLEMHSAYCDGAILRELPDRSGIVQVSNLLRELILAMQDLSLDARSDGPVHRMALVLADQITLQRPLRLSSPPVLSRRLKPIGDALQLNPADSRTLKEWSAELGITTRTLARAFEDEVRMSFTSYRQQVRLHAAATMLANGASVTTVAYDVGFASASNFIAMFRRATGLTPTRYFAGENGAARQ